MIMVKLCSCAALSWSLQHTILILSIGKSWLLTILVLNFEESLFYYASMCLKWCWMSDKQCRPRSDAAFCGIWSGSTLFAKPVGPNTCGYCGIWAINSIGKSWLLTILVLNFEKSLFYYASMCLKWCWMSDKQCRPRSDAAFCGIWSGSTLFAKPVGPNTCGYCGIWAINGFTTVYFVIYHNWA